MAGPMTAKPKSPLMKMVVDAAKKDGGGMVTEPAGKSKTEINEVTIRKAHGGFTVHCSGPGMYASKPVIATNAKKAMSAAMELLAGDTESAGEDVGEPAGE